MIQYLKNILVCLSQTLNALLLGDPDETLSSRLGREYPNSELRKLVDLIFGKNHCNEQSKDDGGRPILK